MAARDAPGEPRQNRNDGEEQARSHQHRTAPNLVREHAQQNRSEQYTVERGAQNRAEHGRGDLPLLAQGGGDIADGLHIEAVHDQTQAAQDEDAYLKCADPGTVDEVRDIDLGDWFHG